MKILLALTFAVGFASPAFAVTDAELIAKQYEVREICRIPNPEVSLEESDRACDESRQLGKQIIARGYCFSRPEVEWVKCELPKLRTRS
jgi:hypothetical protein